MEKVQLIYVMNPSMPFTYSWPVSWQCCPSFEQRGCTLFSTRCQNYGWRFPLFTSFQFINHERPCVLTDRRGTKGVLLCSKWWHRYKIGCSGKLTRNSTKRLMNSKNKSIPLLYKHDFRIYFKKLNLKKILATTFGLSYWKF